MSDELASESGGVDVGQQNASDLGDSEMDSMGRTPLDEDDDDSSDDEPLSVLKKDVKKRNSILRTQSREDEEELALAESNSEDESRREDFVRDYSHEGDLEMLHMPRVAYPFPSYIRQAASALDARRHPLAANPMDFIACQNLQLVLSRRNHPTSPNAAKRPNDDAVSNPHEPDPTTETTKRHKASSSSPTSTKSDSGDDDE
ncbi:unnamed protein product [Aphanomyces euteiches]|uniref:Uncharacterized protein n=1 Tax=Aphanomyces euteiches TaxID=100861 RepID=A0A6G0XVY5_9STRA|nr:hypothetical protein Ae201684_001093 [Aphanomyces euteiches]KAH9099726.1 hypothetical protein Ae201684P_018737 [Aphanomyces euteiches]KAH9145548.1 hypothetical protein AeRB84_010538 [Aphanomyces euteiches]